MQARRGSCSWLPYRQPKSPSSALHTRGTQRSLQKRLHQLRCHCRQEEKGQASAKGEPGASKGIPKEH